MSNGTWRPNTEVGGKPPTSPLELGARIAVVIALFETKKAAAEAANVSDETIRRWERGQTTPPFDVPALLANAKGVSLDWLATGKGDMRTGEMAEIQAPAVESAPSAPPALDHELFGLLNQELTRLYKEENTRINNPNAWGVLLAEKYEEIVGSTDDPDTRKRMVALVVTQQRKVIRTPPTADDQTKRRV